jgi:hypothetical protein
MVIQARSSISEVVPQVSPLHVADYGVSNASYDPYYFEGSSKPHSFPPWHGCILAVLGIWGITWGWRNEKRLPWSLYAFLLGIVLWAWALLILLPWTV